MNELLYKLIPNSPGYGVKKMHIQNYAHVLQKDYCNGIFKGCEMYLDQEDFLR